MPRPTLSLEAAACQLPGAIDETAVERSHAYSGSVDSGLTLDQAELIRANAQRWAERVKAQAEEEEKNPQKEKTQPVPFTHWEPTQSDAAELTVVSSYSGVAAPVEAAAAAAPSERSGPTNTDGASSAAASTSASAATHAAPITFHHADPEVVKFIDDVTKQLCVQMAAQLKTDQAELELPPEAATTSVVGRVRRAATDSSSSPTSAASATSIKQESSASIASSSTCPSSSGGGSSRASKKSRMSTVVTRNPSASDSGDADSQQEEGDEEDHPEMPSGSFADLKHEIQRRRRRVKIPAASIEILAGWFRSHVAKPYPTPHEKRLLMAQAEVDEKQLINWFTNTRKRFWRVHPTDPTKNQLTNERVEKVKLKKETTTDRHTNERTKVKKERTAGRRTAAAEDMEE